MFKRKRNVKITIITFSLILPLLVFCMEPLQAYLTVKTDKCKGCSACVGVCEVDAVRIINGKAVIDPTKCVECGRCVEVCPVDAIY